MHRGRVRGSALLAAACAISLAALAGCSSETEGGLGVPTADLLELPGAERELPGTIGVEDNGCFHIDTPEGRLFVVWPPGFEQDAAVVRSPDGEEFGDGSAVTGMARTVDAATAVEAADGPDGYLHAVTGYCLLDDEQIAVYSALG